MIKKNKFHALILARGEGSRIGFEKPKQFIKVAGKTILEHTIEAFETNELIYDIIIVINPNNELFAEQIVLQKGYYKV